MPPVDPHPDGRITFLPPNPKDEAGYRTEGSPDFDPTHDRCGSCAHFIPGGGCHVVQGNIDPADYCEAFYADYGVFGHDHGDRIEVNMELAGGAMEFSPLDIERFLISVRSRLQRRVRNE